MNTAFHSLVCSAHLQSTLEIKPQNFEDMFIQMFIYCQRKPNLKYLENYVAKTIAMVTIYQNCYLPPAAEGHG